MQIFANYLCNLYICTYNFVKANIDENENAPSKMILPLCIVLVPNPMWQQIKFFAASTSHQSQEKIGWTQRQTKLRQAKNSRTHISTTTIAINFEKVKIRFLEKRNAVSKAFPAIIFFYLLWFLVNLLVCTAGINCYLKPNY